MKQRELAYWLEDSVTREFLELVEQHYEASKNAILEIAIRNKALNDEDLKLIERFKGQFYAMETVMQIETFLKERIEDNNNEKIYRIGTEPNS